MKIFFKSPRLAKSNMQKKFKHYVRCNNSITNKIEPTEDQDTYDPEHSVGGQGASWAPESSRIVNKIKMNNIQII